MASKSTPEYIIKIGIINHIKGADCRAFCIDGTIILRKNFDFPYIWLDDLRFTCNTDICYRESSSGKITDVRLIGTIKRIINKKFGFIDHPFYGGGIYFQMKDVDNALPIEEGNKIAFRVASKAEKGGLRIWALRIWKVPIKAPIRKLVFARKK